MGLKTVIMPKEMGGREYKVLDHIPHKLMREVTKRLPTSTDAATNMSYEAQQKLEEIIILGLVRPPPDLESDDCDGMEMALLAETILSNMDFTQNRINELKKKVQWQ